MGNVEEGEGPLLAEEGKMVLVVVIEGSIMTCRSKL